MLRLRLYAGLSKTGTTTLQDYFAQTAPAWRATGVLYPQAGRLAQGTAHHAAASAFLAPAQRPAWAPPLAAATWRQQLLAEVAATGTETVVVASELFSRADPLALATALAGFDVRVVFALRRQDLFLDAVAQQKLKSLNLRAADAAWLRERRSDGRLDYDRRLRHWASVFGQEALRWMPFEPAVLAGGLVRQMLALGGLANPADLAEPPASNARLGRDAVALLQQLHFDAGFAAPQLRALRPALEQWSARHPEPRGWRHVLAPDVRREILADAAAGNAALHARAPWPGHSTLFADLHVDDDFLPYPGLAPERAAALGDFLLPQVTEPALRAALAAL